MKRARYAPQPLGHYGLAKSNYTHFTSPIRRYADLVVHRALAERDQPAVPGDMGQMASVAEHISITERVAAEAEIDAVKMKKLEFFQRQLDARDPQVFRATVIDVRNYGLLVELPDVLLTGLMHISSLTDDFYVFDASAAPIDRTAIAPPILRGRPIARFRCPRRYLQAAGRFRHRETGRSATKRARVKSGRARRRHRKRSRQRFVGTC